MDKATTATSMQGENEFLEQRIHKLSKEIQSEYLDDGHGGDSSTCTTRRALATADAHARKDHKVNDEASSLSCFETLSKLAEEQGAQLAMLTERARRLVAENEELRKNNNLMKQHQKQSVDKGSRNRETPAPVTRAISSLGNFLNDREIPQDLTLLSEENSCLTEQILLLTNEVDHMKDLLQNREEAIETLNGKLSNISALHKQLESQLHQVHQDKSACEEKLIQRTSKAQLCEESWQQVQIELEGARGKHADLEERVRVLAYDKEQLEAEAEQLSSKLTTTVTELCESKQRLIDKSSEIDSLNEDARTMTEDLVAAKVEAKQLAALANSMKGQIESITIKEAEASRLYELNVIELEEAKLEKEKQSATCASLREQIQKLHNEHRNRVQESWKENAKNLEDLRQRHGEELKALQEEMRKVHFENSKLQHKVDTLMREKAGVLEKQEQMQRTLKEQKGHSQTHFKELLQRIKDAEAHWEQEIGRKLNVELQLKNVSQELAACRGSELNLQKQLRERHEELYDEVKTLRAQNQGIQQRLQEAKGRVEILCGLLDGEKNGARKRLEEAIQIHNATVDALKHELNDARDLAKANEITLREECKRKQQSLDTLRCNTRNSLDCIERKIHDEREVSKRLMASNEDLNARVNILVAENKHSKVILDEAKDKIDILELELEQANCQVAALGKQLSRRIQDRQDILFRERKAAQIG